MTALKGDDAHRRERKAHEWWGDHSVWSDYSEEVEEGSRERKPGPALKILLIRFPNLRSHCPGTYNPRNLRIRPYSKYLKFAPGKSCISRQRFENVSAAAGLARWLARGGLPGRASKMNASADLQPLLLRGRRHHAVQAQVIDDLAVMIGDVPHRDHRDSQLRVRAAVAAFDSFHRIFLVDGGEDFFAVVEGIAQVLQQLGFGLGGRGTALFAAVRRSLAFDLVEESEIRAGHVFHL